MGYWRTELIVDPAKVSVERSGPEEGCGFGSCAHANGVYTFNTSQVVEVVVVVVVAVAVAVASRL